MYVYDLQQVTGTCRLRQLTCSVLIKRCLQDAINYIDNRFSNRFGNRFIEVDKICNQNDNCSRCSYLVAHLILSDKVQVEGTNKNV